MFTFLDGFRELTLVSLILRLTVAALFGGILGLNGTRKRRAAGIRTYMLVCMGSSLTMILGQYTIGLQAILGRSLPSGMVVTVDVCRLSAQVLNGIGFLGAGSILVTQRQQVKGLTTAAALWTSACMGLAVGAGFFECVLAAFFLILLIVFVLSRLETRMVERSKYINLYVEFKDARTLTNLIGTLKNSQVDIYDIDLEHGKSTKIINPNAVLTLHMREQIPHTQLIARLADNADIYSIREI